MNGKRLFTTLPVIAAFALAAAPAGAATDTQTAVSENWAGYAVGNGDGSSDFTSVSGSWVQPTVSCTAGQSNSYSAFWVGIGGSSSQSNALEQTGTQANCDANGQASYYAWYELVPSAPVKLDMTVKPGDHMSAKVTVNGHAVTITVTDATSGQTVTKDLTASQVDTSSAEWIAEAPSQCDSSLSSCQPLKLANFGSVTFTGASATANGHTGTISDSDWTSQAVALSPGASAQDNPGALLGGGYTGAQESSSTAGAEPSSLSSDGSSFGVDYQADATSQAGSSGYGTSGYPGTSGYGTSGYPGTSGYGTSGYPDTSGYGTSGYPGTSGYGTSGYPGTSGYGYGYGDSGASGYGSGYPGTSDYGYGNGYDDSAAAQAYSAYAQALAQLYGI